MAYMVLHFQTEDYDAWKQAFDSDPAGRRETRRDISSSAASTTRTKCSVRAEFDSVETAQAFRKRLLDPAS